MEQAGRQQLRDQKRGAGPAGEDEGQSTIVMPHDMLHLAHPERAGPRAQQSARLCRRREQGMAGSGREHPAAKRFPTSSAWGAAALPRPRPAPPSASRPRWWWANILHRIQNGALSTERYRGYSSCRW